MIPETITPYLPTTFSVISAIFLLWFMHWFLLARHTNLGTEARLPRQLLMLILTLAAIVMVIIVFPMSDSTRGQVITLLGIVITGIIALSSTTFVTNVMAGLMLHVVRSFSPGDFIRVGNHFGRVTERGLFHTEIQTEDRDLTTLPNLHLATNPLTVVHSSGTIMSTELSLGYDIPHQQVEDLLKQAAQRAELQDPFVLIISLNDFSITYKVSGFLLEIKNLITAKSNLKKCVIDILHENDIEIVSPNFMNQRQLPANKKIIPQESTSKKDNIVIEEPAPEELIFNKAEVAAESEALRSDIDKLLLHIDEMTKTKKGLSKEQQETLNKEIEIAERQKQALLDKLEKLANVSEK